MALTDLSQAANPTHLYPYDATTSLTTLNTAGSILDLAALINQGDDYFQRFGAHVDMS